MNDQQGGYPPPSGAGWPQQPGAPQQPGQAPAAYPQAQAPQQPGQAPAAYPQAPAPQQPGIAPAAYSQAPAPQQPGIAPAANPDGPAPSQPGMAPAAYPQASPSQPGMAAAPTGPNPNVSSENVGLFGTVPCPYCGTPTTAGSGASGVGTAVGGLVGYLVVKAFAASYYCPQHGKIPKDAFPANHRQSIMFRRIATLGGAGLVLFVVFILLIALAVLQNL